MDFKNLFKSFIFSKHSIVVFLLVFTQLVLTGFSKVLIKKNAYNDADQLKFALLAFIISLLFGGIIKVYSFYVYAKKLRIKTESDVYQYAFSKFADWAVVEVRAQMRVLLRLFLFIIPGIVEAIRLSLAIPYVFLDERMKDPTFDPIEESRNKILAKGPYFWPLFLVVIVLPVAIALSINSDQTVFDSASSFVFGVFGSAVQTISIVIYYAYIIDVFLNEKEVKV